MERVIIIGGGVLGTMHAREAVRRGFDVLQVERDAGPRSASVRNFGLIWVSGRAPGAELDLALRSRELWESVAGESPGVGFRPHGSLTLAMTEDEAKVMQDAADMSDAARREMTYVEPGDIRRINPAVRGDVLGGLWCKRDAIVEPTHLLAAVRERLAETRRYRFLPNRTVVDADLGLVVDHTGQSYECDLVIACPGAAYDLPIGAIRADSGLGRCRLQMMETEPHCERLTTSIADGDSLRYYPAYAMAPLDLLAPQAEPARGLRMQLLLVQRADGSLTIGDTHAYDEPFPVGVEESTYDHLRDTAERILGMPVPPTRRRWSGVYSQPPEGQICHRSFHLGVTVVTGAGGRGMTLAPALAEETWDML